ncbi:MAG: restriction endonuclease subunit S [Prevotella sp.]|nr:restriction endonuclease subunit S [Prevotella sp.]
MKEPRLRLKEFVDNWKVIKLSEIARRVTRKNSHLESTLPLTISAAEGLISQISFFNNIVASSNLSGYYLIKKGEFAYNKSSSAGHPFGSIKRLNKYEEGALSTLYIVFNISGDVSSDYVTYFFDTSLWYKEVAMRAFEGARNHGLLNIGANDFLDINISLPADKREQQAIADFFKSLDSMITLTSKKIEKLKQTLTGCMQTMFPQEGEFEPKIRFKGFEGEWEKVKFSELYEPSSIKNKTYGPEKIISVANMYFKPVSYISNDDYLKSYNVMNLGDIAFEGNKSKNYAHGRFVENFIGNGIVSHVFIVLKPKSKQYDLQFWRYLINYEGIMGPILLRSTKHSTMMTDLVVGDFLKENILVPSYTEQKEIGAYFNNLDTLIALQTKRLDLLKHIKSACLDNMFV